MARSVQANKKARINHPISAGKGCTVSQADEDQWSKAGLWCLSSFDIFGKRIGNLAGADYLKRAGEKISRNPSLCSYIKRSVMLSEQQEDPEPRDVVLMKNIEIKLRKKMLGCG